MSVFENAAGSRGKQKARPVGIPFALGIAFLPIVFAWFTLRAGYSTSVRIMSFGWMALGLMALASTGASGPSTAAGSTTTATAESASTASPPTDNRTFSQFATDALVAPQMNAITDKVARDSVDQYNISLSGGDKIEICVHAGFVAAAFLQAKDQPNYLKWKQAQRSDCAAAGMPTPG
jgi:hypothetical protein